MGDVLWKAVRRNRISRSEAENSLRRFASLAIQILPTSDLLDKALQIAVAYRSQFLRQPLRRTGSG